MAGCERTDARVCCFIINLITSYISETQKVKSLTSSVCDRLILAGTDVGSGLVHEGQKDPLKNSWIQIVIRISPSSVSHANVDIVWKFHQNPSGVIL